MFIYGQQPDYTQITDKWFRLNKPIVYEFNLERALKYEPELLAHIREVTGVLPGAFLYLTAPTGFITDLASVPAALQGLFAIDGPYVAAAILHDMMYGMMQYKMPWHAPRSVTHAINGNLPRKLADRLFKIGMEDLGVSSIVRNLIYQGVRVGGDSSFSPTKYPRLDYRLPETPLCHILDQYSPYLPISLSPNNPSYFDESMLEAPGHYVMVRYHNISKPLLFNTLSYTSDRFVI